MKKCLRVKIADIVIHKGKHKSVIATCLSAVMLSDVKFKDLKSGEFEYGNWIDLDEVEFLVSPQPEK